MTHGYGWKPDLPDQRDHLYAGAHAVPAILPDHVDLTDIDGYPDPYDQGQLGSCTAQAIAAALQFDALVQGTPTPTPSRLFVYYNERVLEHTVSEDAGAQIRDGIKTVAKQGAPDEALWPYRTARFAQRPPDAAYTAARKDVALAYQRLRRTPTLYPMRNCLAAGRPFILGFSVYESFESDQTAATGIAPMPQRSEQLLGGHAVLAVGYDDAKQAFLCRNSWGTSWGQHGHFWLPYTYLRSSSLSRDFWTITTTGSAA